MSGSLAAVTPAFNEAGRLPALCESVRRQTQLPVRWIIVDDGSTDDTRARAIEATASLDFVTVVSREQHSDRSFASKVGAFQHGVSQLEGDSYDYLACFDADVMLPERYIEEIVRGLDQDPNLGVTGGLYRHPVGKKLVVDRPPMNQVPGPAQVFRRATFEDIGGYQGMPHGGEDALANVAARMHGWTTRCRPDLVVDHNRRMGTGGDQHPVRAEYHKGLQDHDLGAHPLFEVGKLVKRLTRPPYVVGSFARALGYLRGVVDRTRTAPDDVISFWREEQLGRIRSLLAR